MVFFFSLLWFYVGLSCSSCMFYFHKVVLCVRRYTQLQFFFDNFSKNLSMVCELNDKAAQGRVFGNLGNTYYLLGDFDKAIHYHQQV